MEVDRETCPNCNHPAHETLKCKDKSGEGFFMTQCLCRISWPLTERQAMQNLAEQSRHRQDWVKRLHQAQMDLANAEQKLDSAHSDEDTALWLVETWSKAYFPSGFSERPYLKDLYKKDAPTIKLTSARTTKKSVEKATPTRMSPIIDGADNEDVPMTGGEIKLLQTLAKRHPIKMTKGVLALASGYRPTSGTFLGNLVRLRKREYMLKEGYEYSIMSAGFEAIDAEPSQTPQTPEEILAMWQERLNGTEWKLLNYLIGCDTEQAKEEIAEANEYSVRSGTFLASLVTLRKAGLITKNGSGFVISEELVA